MEGNPQYKVNTYKEALDFLYSQLPMFQRQGATAMKKNLDNILALCSFLGQAQNKFPSIHVAGTNGKGSTAHMLSALLQSQGYRVGVYTSPHYKDFRERIKINNGFISKREVVEFIELIRDQIEKIRPSFFEITVAMAFHYFAQQKVDIAIIEVGLGGRLDSTNVITPLVSVITNISKDHMQFLGDTLVEIAGEKAGIIKKDIPVVIGEKQDEVFDVFLKKAQENDAQLILAEEIVEVSFDEAESQGIIDVLDKKIPFEAHWFADYQRYNLQTAIASFIQWADITGHTIDWDQVPKALLGLPEISYFVGRWMTLGESPKIIAESAHNEAGLALMSKKLWKLKYKHYHFVLGFSNDKDLDTVLHYFPQNATYYFAKADIPRGLEAKKLQEKAREYHLKGRAYVSVKNAYKAAKRNAGKEDFIYVGGSIFIVSEVL